MLNPTKKLRFSLESLAFRQAFDGEILFSCTYGKKVVILSYLINKTLLLVASYLYFLNSRKVLNSSLLILSCTLESVRNNSFQGLIHSMVSHLSHPS